MSPSAERQDPEASYRANRAWWDAVTPAHVRSDFYDVPGFLAGRNTIPQFVLDEVGDVRGRSLLHLQCHFGLDTLSWARLGATVTGVDFSEASIAEARRLAREAGLNASFVVADVIKLGDRFDGAFDIVFTSFGVVCWLHDLAPWAEAVARALGPGGTFHIAEFHPLMDSLDDRRAIRRTSDLVLRYPYFHDGRPHIRADEEGWGDYADRSFRAGLPTHEWYHSLGELFEAVTAAGLAVQSFREYPFCTYQAREGMVKGHDGLWRMPDGVLQVPLTFTLRARKPQRRPGT
ncbi:MAG: class I SAM-dependent methyltransferase [Gemmatimonadetes bacterium]|nr:class I SAM-dependent methyltransferase [Gemmatimonadota bacterium]